MLKENTTDMLPLIRLKIEYGIKNYKVINTKNLDAFFTGQIANIRDYLQFYKKGSTTIIKKSKENDCCMEEMDVDEERINQEFGFKRTDR
jgi:hypothetical protein